jgi:hypothetical protein
VALFLGFFTGLDKVMLFNWQILWLALVGMSYVIALGFFKHGLARWSGNPLEVPNAGPLAVILCGIAWSLCALAGLSTGLTIALAVIFAGIYYVRSLEN